MRCPKCKFISADKRDLCPKCLLDLRPEKLRTGLPVSRPKASYEDLLRLAKNKRSKSKGSNSESPSKKTATPPPTPINKVEPEQPSVPLVETKKEKQKPIWSRLLTKFNLASPKKKIATEEKQVIAHETPKVEAKTEEPAPAISETAQAVKIGIDEQAFESIFEEISEAEESPIEVPVEASLATPLESPVTEPKSEPSEEDFAILGEEMSLKLAQAISSTELLRELPSPSYASQISQATPEVVEFHEDDDALLEEQLNQLLGDEIVEISSVKVPKKATQSPQPNSIKVDDLEISFEFEMDNNQEAVEIPKAVGEQAQETAAPPAFESKSINQLEAALLALDAEFGAPDATVDVEDEDLIELLQPESTSEEELSDDEESLEEIDNLESLKNDLIGLDDDGGEDDEEEGRFDLSPLKGSIPGKLKNSPSELANYLLQVLADTVGCKPEDLFNDEVIEATADAFESTDESTGSKLQSAEEDSTVIDENEFKELIEELESDEPLQEVKEEEELQALFESVEPDEDATESQISLWDLAETELESQDTEGEELELTQLVSRENKEELLVLFDAALKALDDKKLEAGYTAKIKTSVGKELDSEDLSIVFEKYADAAVKQHDENFSSTKKKPVYANVPKDVPLVQSTEAQLVPLTRKDIFKLLLKSTVLGFSVGVGHLWFFDLIESSREAILSYQLFWLALPYLAKNLGIALILAAGFFYFRVKNQYNQTNDAPLTL